MKYSIIHPNLVYSDDDDDVDNVDDADADAGVAAVAINQGRTDGRSQHRLNL